jgi:uncharacterized protein YndB with AHSA1/START domain
VDVTASLDAPQDPSRVFAVVADLATYPRWLDIVPRAEADDGADDVWLVWLRGRLGPLARSKRLRMRRTLLEAPHRVRFEREERDGRRHSPWVLDASVAPATGGGSRLTMRLHYGGALLGPVVERLLGDEIDQSRDRLLDVLAGD